MPTFDFIAHEGFRTSLENDYSDLLSCYDTAAWKSVLVLAGSIVEALLIDYLVATHGNRGGKDPLRMDLAEAINICKAERVLTERTADLCSVVRSYRNLIHPGRVVRLGEARPTEASAKIAVALVELLVEEVASKRQVDFGISGEQIISKIERDPNALSFLKHLLIDVNEKERERLLLHLLPEHYLTIVDQEQFTDEDLTYLHRLAHAFRIVLDAVADPVKSTVSARFVEIIKSADGDIVSSYGTAFVRGGDLQYIADQYRPLVKEFMLSRMSSSWDFLALEMVHGLETYLDETEVWRWVDPIIRALTSPSTSSDLKVQTRAYFETALVTTPREVDRAVLSRLGAWRESYLRNGSPAAQQIVEEMIAVVPPLPPSEEDRR
jgi:hypothetical protein